MSKASRVRHPAVVTPLAQRGPSCPLSAGKQNKRNVYFVGINVRQEVSSAEALGTGRDEWWVGQLGVSQTEVRTNS